MCPNFFCSRLTILDIKVGMLLSRGVLIKTLPCSPKAMLELDSIRHAVCSLRSQRRNIKWWGGGGKGIKYLKKKHNYVHVSQLFLSKIVVWIRDTAGVVSGLEFGSG